MFKIKNLEVSINNKKIIKDFNIEINPGKIKANFQLNNSVKVPAITAPEPIPTPPKIPLMPRALPCFVAELITQGIPTGW